jgi:flotillin
MDLMSLVYYALLGGGGAFGLLMIVVLLKQFLYVSRPSELLIFSGRQQRLADGSSVGYRVIHGGWAVRVPILEMVHRMDLTTIPIDLQVKAAYSKGGIPLHVHAVAYVKVTSDPARRHNAIERFLIADDQEIRRVAKESLEGQLRGIIARMTPEEVNHDRLKFAEEMAREIHEDFDRLGIELDTLKVQSVHDDVQYLDSIGRERLSQVLSSAEIAESAAKADAEQAEALANQQGQVAYERAENSIKQAENEMRRIAAQLEAAAKSEEERAEQGGLAARATAEQRLQEIRGRLEGLRLMADVVLPAEAQKRAAELRSRAEAASIAADGEALAEVLRMLTEIWLKAGDDARDIFLIQQLEVTLARVAEKVKQLEIGDVTLIDNGDGRALAAHVASLPNTVASVFEALRRTTGVDVTGILADRKVVVTPAEVVS